MSLGNDLTAGLGLPPAPAQGALSMASGSDMTWVGLHSSVPRDGSEPLPTELGVFKDIV